jgi:hypothetical protein
MNGENCTIFHPSRKFIHKRIYFAAALSFKPFLTRNFSLPIIFHFKLHSTQERKAIKKINNKSFGIHSGVVVKGEQETLISNLLQDGEGGVVV